MIKNYLILIIILFSCEMKNNLKEPIAEKIVKKLKEIRNKTSNIREQDHRRPPATRTTTEEIVKQQIYSSLKHLIG